MHPGVTVENSKGQKDELIVQGKGTFRYYVMPHTGLDLLKIFLLWICFMGFRTVL